MNKLFLKILKFSNFIDQNNSKFKNVLESSLLTYGDCERSNSQGIFKKGTPTDCYFIIGFEHQNMAPL